MILCYSVAIEESLIQFISGHYALDRVVIEGRPGTTGERIVYRVTSVEGEFVVKITQPSREEWQVRRDVDMLEYLARSDFPAPRLRRARDGATFLPFTDRFVYLYSYVQGDRAQPAVLFFEKIGSILAILHSLSPLIGDCQSEYRPQSELPRVKVALSQLTGAHDRVRAIELMKIIDDFPSIDHLPTSLIHGDPYFTNFVLSGRDEIVLIDWDDAGLSYPILDVGYVLAHLCTVTPQDQLNWNPASTQKVAWRPDWANAFLASYNRRRPLTESEIQFLPHAIEFSVLSYIFDLEEKKILYYNYLRWELFQNEVHPQRVRGISCLL